MNDLRLVFQVIQTVKYWLLKIRLCGRGAVEEELDAIR